MKRTAIKELNKWNENPNRKPLIVRGARQVGKTYLILELFAKEEYKNRHIYIDFKIEDEIRDFCNETANPMKIIEFISLSKNHTIDRNTLLIFDEIQECPNIISSLKYFCQDYPEIPVIATGSMVRIKIQRESTSRSSSNNGKFLFPVGKIDQLTIFPMTFDEYLINANEMLYDKIFENYKRKEPLENSIHNMALDYFDKYLLIGGMPEAVDDYLKNNDYISSRKILQNLYDNYLADMELYQASRESVLRSRKLFQNIYTELNKESKNFSPSLIEVKSKTRDFDLPIEWLRLAHIVNQSFQLSEHLNLPLTPKNDYSFRLFLCDIGMFYYQSGINATSFIASKKNNLTDIFFENFVACELKAKGNELFYWRGKNTAEFEFVLSSNGKVFPLDVKKNKGTLNSLDKFSNHNAYECAIKISRNNYGYDKDRKLLTIPYYFTPFLAEDMSRGRFSTRNL